MSRRDSDRPVETRSLSDEELCARAIRELPYRTRAYEELMRRYETMLFGICFRMIGNRQDAEDVTQDVLIKLFMSLPGFESRASFKTWSARIASNASKDWIKKKATSRHYTSALANEPIELPTTEYEENRLVELLQELPDIDREILTLRFVADLSLTEISESTELGLSATKMRLYRAIERLQQLADTVYGDELSKTN